MKSPVNGQKESEKMADMANTKVDIRVYPIDEPKGTTMAFASIAFNDLVAIRGIRVVDSENKGLFVSMPQSLDKKANKYLDTAFPIDGDLRIKINADVLDEYNRVSKLAPEQRVYDKPDMAVNNIKAENIKLDVRVYPIAEPQNGLKAFASVSIDDLVAIRSVRVVEGEKGLEVKMPQSQNKKTNEFHDIAYPINGDLRKLLNIAILDEYKNVEKSADKSLANGLRKGAEKAAETTAIPRESASKSRFGAGALE